jgi:membrane-bound serine protease (ClpP class)
MSCTMHTARKLAALAAAVLMFAAIWLFAAASRAQEASSSSAPIAFVIDIDGAIGVGTAFNLRNGFEEARKRNASLVILRMDTPGGLVSATREIIKLILSSPIPVAVYVAPTGARAASAGTYMAYAAHVAAMAPGTHLGAATPVSIGSSLTPAQKDPKDGGEKKPGGRAGMQDKVLNDAVAYIRSLAQLRGRNADWAEKAVREAATMTSSDALKNTVIDFVAKDIPDLLQQTHGKTVVVGGSTRPVASRNAAIVEYAGSWKASFLSAITNPNIAFILLLVGFYGIIFEFWTPGLGGSGVIGAVCLLVAFAALSMLPLNYAGLALVLLGIGLMVAEGVAPGFGILGIGGVAAFVLGGVFLFDPDGADIDFGVAWPVLLSTAITTALLFIAGLGLVMRVSRRKVVSGAEYLIDAQGVVVDWKGDEGLVRVQGENWKARAATSLAAGQKVTVQSRSGLILHVSAEHTAPDHAPATQQEI